MGPERTTVRDDAWGAVPGVIACHDCGLFQRHDEHERGTTLSCVRCAAVLRRARRVSPVLPWICLTIAALLLLLALTGTLFEMRLVGRFARASLLSGPRLLALRGLGELSVVVVLTVLLAPALHLLVVLMALLAGRRETPPRWLLRPLVVAEWMRRWSMIEVFLLAALIAYVRLNSWANISVGRSLIALGGAVLCTIATVAAFDAHALWARVPLSRPALPFSLDRRDSWIACSLCHLVNQARDGQRCARCARVLRFRKPQSRTNTVALVVTATLLTWPANAIPVMEITQFGRRNIDTILSGVVELTQHHLWGLAVLIFVASIIIPVLKLLALAVMLWMTRQQSSQYLEGRTRLYRFVHGIGHWSMVDVFAVTILVSLVHMGTLATIAPGKGVLAFCSVVVTTMFATEAFDPRVMWDAAGLNQRAREEHGP
jgi:paraquat-inducible protein A